MILMPHLLLLLTLALHAQPTREGYARAANLSTTTANLDISIPGPATWINATDTFWYRRTIKGGHEFVIANGATKRPAFDHARLAAALSKAIGETYQSHSLPFQTLTFPSPNSFEFTVNQTRWRVNTQTYQPENLGPDNSFPRKAAPPRERRVEEAPVPSPDGTQEALIQNHNIYLRQKSAKTAKPLTYDGSESNAYARASIVWSPDSRNLAAYRIRTGLHRKIQYIESSPLDRLQPKTFHIEYEKPGDQLDLQQPVLINLANASVTPIDDALFPNPYRLSNIEWRKDSRAFTFEYNQRSHQVYRVIEVNAKTAQPRAIVTEAPQTFFCYSSKKFRHDLNDGRELIWMSERDDWNHLYLIDAATGQPKSQITRGPWVVRGVDKVDESTRTIYFHASGMYASKDPYFVHYYRINFDGTALIPLTTADANHTVAFSKDMSQYVDHYSRIDLPPVSELHRTADQSLVAMIETSRSEALKAANFHAPEPFIAKARDGQTDIYGILHRPSHFDPAKRYPVVEYIYAGPHDSFVPKSFAPYSALQSLAELGFIVVQIDGMGTSNRSKAFHDVAWRNLADAGFPDRILWHKALAAKYPWYDISKVGIYGHSAGGQNALGALLFHPEFYKVAVSSCGCHDNRMDKIWWNEQWMGWPLGPEYIACSNAENAGKLKGKLLLSVGELDNNVDPASTMQVVNALIKAKKTFDFIMLPGEGHSWGGVYGERKRWDFFVHNLLNTEPPDWNQ